MTIWPGGLAVHYFLVWTVRVRYLIHILLSACSCGHRSASTLARGGGYSFVWPKYIQGGINKSKAPPPLDFLLIQMFSIIFENTYKVDEPFGFFSEHF